KVQFLTGRWCAHESLRPLGLGQEAIKRGERGDPIWPVEVCGSISHTKGAYSAAAAFRKNYRALGIDIESTRRQMSPAAFKHVSIDEERRWISSYEDQ